MNNNIYNDNYISYKLLYVSEINMDLNKLRDGDGFGE